VAGRAWAVRQSPERHGRWRSTWVTTRGKSRRRRDNLAENRGARPTRNIVPHRSLNWGHAANAAPAEHHASRGSHPAGASRAGAAWVNNVAPRRRHAGNNPSPFRCSDGAQPHAPTVIWVGPPGISRPVPSGALGGSNPSRPTPSAVEVPETGAWGGHPPSEDVKQALPDHETKRGRR